MAADLRDVDDFDPFAQAEVHGLVGPLVEIFEERGRHLEQPALDGGTHAEREKMTAQVKLAVHAIEQTGVDKLGGQPMQGGFGQTGPTLQISEPDTTVIGREGIQNQGHLRDDGHPRSLGASLDLSLA